MILGLGAGMGFIYWHQKGVPPFVGGRGNTKNFFEDLGNRTGVKITETSTSSEKKAESALLEKLQNKEPVMLFGDMGFLPWFEMPDDYHFGGHTFVICGYDGQETVLASDMEQKASGLKKGFYYPITLEQLKKARSSKFKPFPPKNTSLDFNFENYHDPVKEDIYSSIGQTVNSMLNPPISNFGVTGIRKTAKEIQNWPSQFSDFDLRMNLFTIYIFIEIGGTGGGCFRYMYSRFLKEAADLTGNDRLNEASVMMNESGQLFTAVGLLFENIEDDDIELKINEAQELLHTIADKEEQVYHFLSENSE